MSDNNDNREMILKQGDEVLGPNCLITVSEGSYSIRPFGSSGGIVIDVTKGGDVFFRQNGNVVYSLERFERLTELIHEGRKYMKDLENGKVHIPEVTTILPKNYIENGIYQNNKGEYILYLGQGRFRTGIRHGGAKYGWGRVQSLDSIKYTETLCVLNGMLDGYMGKPKNLVKLVGVLPDTVRDFVYGWDYTGDGPTYRNRALFHGDDSPYGYPSIVPDGFVGETCDRNFVEYILSTVEKEGTTFEPKMSETNKIVENNEQEMEER